MLPATMCVLSLAAQLWTFAGLWVLLLMPYLTRFHWIKRHFQRGDVNAAKVIATDPYLVAAFADLSTSGEYFFPVIRILEQPLDRLGASGFETGYNMPTVSLYYGSAAGYKWDSFNPIVAQCATTDEAEIRRLLEMIPEWQWALLNEGLFQLPQPYRPGLYQISVGPLGEA